MDQNTILQQVGQDWSNMRVPAMENLKQARELLAKLRIQRGDAPPSEKEKQVMALVEQLTGFCQQIEAQFIVVQLTGGIIPNGDYSIIPAKALYPSIYTMVFGPDTYSMCDQWINEQTPFQFLDAIAVGYGGGGTPHGFGDGGGGGAPHGLKAILKSNAGRSGNPRGLEVEAFKTKK